MSFICKYYQLITVIYNIYMDRMHVYIINYIFITYIDLYIINQLLEIYEILFYTYIEQSRKN